MVNTQSPPPRTRSSVYSQPIPSPLHGRFPISTPTSPQLLPSSTTYTTLPPLSPKSQSTPSREAAEKERTITQLSFPPPLKRHVQHPLILAFDHPSEIEDEIDWELREEVFVGEWKIGESLGRGTSGTVKLGRSIKSGVFAAIKKVRRLPQTHKEASLVHREIALMKLVAPHPHLVELFDVYETHDDLYLITEYCPQGELFQYVQTHVLTPFEVHRFYSQLISALLHLSQLSISHRDIKFENLILFTDSDGHHSLKLADMGMATLQLSSSLLKTSCGSPHYAAPEIIEGKPYDGGLADVWSSGVCLFAMIARRLPFDHEHIPTLLGMIKLGEYEWDEVIQGWEKEIVEGSLRRDVKERFTLEEISRHPYLTSNPRPPSIQLFDGDGTVKKERDFVDFENLDLAILASLGIVLKVALLDEVKEMLRLDLNHARYFYSKLLYFRQTAPTLPPTVSSSTTYDEIDDDSTELYGSVVPSISTSHFPVPPPPPSPAFPPFDPSKVIQEIEQTTPSKWDPLLNPPRASLLSHEILQSLAHSHSHSEHTSYSAPPQTQTFPSYLNCLHEFGPIASAPPQIESFPSEPLPSLPRLTEDLPRKSSVAITESNKPFLDLEQSDSTSLRSDYSYSVLDRPSIDSTRSNERIPRKKPSMHQRIRSLLSPPSPRPNSQHLPLPYPVSPRISTTQAVPTRARPHSPTPSTATTSSRLTRSSAYRSLGRALLGKDPKSPVLETTFPSTEISYAQRVVLETLSPSSASPVPSSTFSLNSRQKEKIGDDLRFLASTSSSSSSPALLLQPKEGTKTVRKSTIKKKLSSRMLEFFHDNDESTSSSAATPTTSITKLTKQKRRPQALSIASSNLLAVNAKIESRPPSLVKKLSSFALGSSRSSQPLAPPSPLTLNSPTPISSNFDQSDTPSSIIASLQSYPLRSSSHSSRRPNSELLTFPVRPT
ncbi:hypothetical protein JCM5353_008018, partial [Sporobolomyces roseus]